MNCLRPIQQVVFGALLLSFGCPFGCQPQQPLYLHEKGQYQSKMITKATRLEYPDTEVPSTMEVCSTINPLTLENPSPTHYWDLTLEEAIQMAFKNSRVIRTLNGVGFSKQGVSGTPGTLLSSPTAIGTVYDPALIESDPRYGQEAALSAFDAQLTASTTWSKSDMPRTYSSAASQTDAGTMSVGLSKFTAPGGQFYMNHVDQYSHVDGVGSGWASYIEGGFSQPLLQGNGIQFNRIAGPGATPGFYNGVMIARINTDQALNDFEMAARNLVADVEKAYWNLYYAYHYLESVKSGRDSAHQTWQQTYAMYKIGAPGGRAQYEAQSRNNYFSFRAQTEVAQSNLFKNENVLRYIMGLTSTDGRLIRPADEPIIAPLRLEWQNVMCEALHRSPELRKQKWDVKKKEYELIASKNFLLPRLDLNGSYRWNGAGRDLLNSDNSRSNAYGSLTSGNYGGWVMGLSASVPLGFRRELAGVRNAQLGLAKSRSLLQEQELELTHQLADSFREVTQTYQQSRTQLQRRLAANDEVSSVNAAYKAGTTTLDQLLDAQKRQAEAETDYYRSVVDYNLAIMTLHYRKGSLLEYDNVCLSEGPWPGKAYFDATKRARQRDSGMYMNYGFTRPRISSRGPYQQHQNTMNGVVFGDGGTIDGGQPMYQEGTVVPQGEPILAPPSPSIIETNTSQNSTQSLTPSSSVARTVAAPKTINSGEPVVVARAESTSENTQVSYTKANSNPSKAPARNNRYIETSSIPVL